jgi:hypothetical protein
MAETCEHCHLVHADPVTRANLALIATPLNLEGCLAAQRTAMRSLLEKIGRKTSCDSCGKTIYFVRHTNGANAPYTEAGLIHFVDCPERDRFKRPK